MHFCLLKIRSVQGEIGEGTLSTESRRESYDETAALQTVSSNPEQIDLAEKKLCPQKRNPRPTATTRVIPSPTVASSSDPKIHRQK